MKVAVVEDVGSSAFDPAVPTAIHSRSASVLVLAVLSPLPPIAVEGIVH